MIYPQQPDWRFIPTRHSKRNDEYDTAWSLLDAMPANTAIGYTHPRGQDQTWKSNTSELPGRGSSAGGGYSTLDDMRNFVHALLNGKLLLDYTLPEAVSGKVGVWSKTDSVSYFDDYVVTPAP